MQLQLQKAITTLLFKLKTLLVIMKMVTRSHLSCHRHIPLIWSVSVEGSGVAANHGATGLTRMGAIVRNVVHVHVTGSGVAANRGA